MVDRGELMVACVVVRNVPRLSVFWGDVDRVSQFVGVRFRGSDNGNSRFPSGMTIRKATSQDTTRKQPARTHCLTLG
jgi:hypothetical protein